MTPHFISSDLLPAPRQVWVRQASTSETAAARDCLIFLDGELYRDRVKVPDILAEAEASGHLPPLTAVYVSNIDSAARHTEFTCNETFSRFVAIDLIAWIRHNIGAVDRLTLCGLSLSGLCAVFTGLRHPGVFDGIVAQSPSAWWEDERLAASLPLIDAAPVTASPRFWISVGDKETQENVVHPPTSMVQKTSQVDSVHRLTAKMASSGYDVHQAGFDGGHDPSCWGAEMTEAFVWVLER